MIKVCVFDLDGTVMDTLASIAYFVNQTMQKMNLPEIEIERFKYFAGDGRAALIHRALAHNGADTPENFNIATEYYDEAYQDNFMHLTKPFDGIFEELEKIKSHGIKIAVLSNKPHNVAQLVIDETFGKDFFVHVQGQMDDVAKKPDPAGLIGIMKEFGVSPRECVMVGDTDVDMITGKNAEVHTLGVLWGFRPRTELEQNGAEKIIASVSELADAVVSF